MATYKAPVPEILFVLNDVLDVSELASLPNYSDATPDIIQGVVEEAARQIEEKIAPLNSYGDEKGCQYLNGEVRVPDGYAEAYRLFRESGWVGLSNPVEFGGQGLPFTLAKVVGEMVCSANVAFELFIGLTQDCFEAIYAKGSETQKQTYCHKLATGEWTGTMCITEPHAGSDVGSARTKAVPQADGSYLLEGSKIFITSGEHDMADNIVHFVLARMPDSPPGVKGLSTFVVPKYLVNTDGSIGERNKVRCLSIEEKMGMHGSCTCTMSFESARGWLVGQPNHGIQNMFVMMNLARIMVGFQGLGQCELAMQNAIRYANERKQGRSLGGSNSDVPIIEHPDVRRMLLTMKAVTEGARVMCYETSKQMDIAHHHPDEAVREAAQDWVDLSTPLVKAFCTDSAVELASLAIQVYGGHGYIREHGIEQIMRDSKILCLYEGTNGIQAMDLVRRKLMMHNGRLAQRFFAGVRADLEIEGAEFITRPLAGALRELEETTSWLQKSFRDSPDDAAFGCTDYLRAFSLTYLGWNWLRMLRAAERAGNAKLIEGKRTTAIFFARRMLPQVHSLCAIARSGAGEMMALAAENF